MKKSAISLIALLLALSFLAGCYNPATVMKIGGTDIPAGIYLHYQLEATFEASSLAGDGISIGVGKALFESTVEEQPAHEWITARTREYLREYTFIGNEFARLGLSNQSLDSMAALYDSTIQAEWSSYASFYTPNGIGYNTYKTVYRNSLARSMVYEALYVEEGAPKRPPESDIESYFSENYIQLDFIRMPNTDGAGTSLDDAGKAALKEAAESMADAAEQAAETAGGVFADGANPGIEAALPLYYEYAGIAEGDRESKRTEVLTSNVTVASSYADYDAAFLAAAFESSAGGYAVYQNSTDTYLFCRRSVDDSEADLLETYSYEVIVALSEDSFNEYVKTEAALLEIVEDDRAANYYRPEKIKV